jgi:UDP:flavonoid glycosyltransferase YjiC (YdhE family)
MSKILWVCWDGGGNLTPSLGIASELVRRGHQVSFHGRQEMVTRAQASGHTAYALDQALTDQEAFSFHPLVSVFGYCCSPAVGEEVVQLVEESDPDLVVVDAMFGAALDVAPRFRRPTAVMVHTLLYRGIDAWRANFAMQSETRERAGFPRLADLDTLWGDRHRVHVNTLGSLDGEPTVGWSNVVHGAPVLANEGHALPVDIPWPTDDPTPLVLLSFSTVPEQRSAESLQRALDALGRLPVHVVATTGGVVEPGELSPPANAHVVSFADHDTLLARAALVVGHGGHGTTMRTLRAGLPLVGMPAKGADQASNLRLIEQLRAGRSLAADATVDQISSAVVEVLADPSYREAARRLATGFEGRDGAALAADSLEALLPTADLARA